MFHADDILKELAVARILSRSVQWYQLIRSFWIILKTDSSKLDSSHPYMFKQNKNLLFFAVLSDIISIQDRKSDIGK